MPPPSADIPIGAYVEVAVGAGHVRFCGATSFASGKWVGIELDSPTGKNDGSVAGVPYFRCQPQHGVFVRPSQAKVLRAPSRANTPSSPRTPSNPSLPPAGPSRATSFRSTASSSSRSTSPAKPAVNNYAPAVPTRMGPPATPKSALKAPTPLQTPPSRLLVPRRAPSRDFQADVPPSPVSSPSPAVKASASTANGFGHPPSRRSSLALSKTPLQAYSEPPPPSSPILKTPSPRTTSSTSVPSPVPLTPPTPTSAPSSSLSTSPPSQSLPTAVSPQATTPEPIAPPPQPPVSDESQELRIKLRVSEQKRNEDSQRIRELEERLSEADALVTLRPKLVAKIQTLQNEITTYKRDIADLKVAESAHEEKLQDRDEQMEMIMLDKEVAEERAEAAEALLEEEKEKRAEIEVQLDVYKREREMMAQSSSGADGAEGSGASVIADVKASMDYIQLEKQNERLKEALLRLRDISQETDTEQRKKIADLERELAAADDMQSQFEQTISQLENAENQIDDLKQQLDDALGAEDMLVQLTERNLLMGEKIEEMRVTIEDLEALKELNDEIEEAHVETEKALQDDIDEKEMQLHAQSRAIEVLQDAVADYENTIAQFRELVTNLQTELEAQRELSQTHQTESRAQASQAAAALTMNMKLQSTAAKNQAKTIDLELRRLDGAQGRELLSIIQPYLPQAYIENDRDAANCYMFFQRLSYKIELIHKLVGQSFNLPESLQAAEVSDQLVGVCELRGMASHASTLCKRFCSIMQRCDGETYIRLGKLFSEVAPIEKRIDLHIEALRQEEFRHQECALEMGKILGRLEHLAETEFSGFDSGLAERELDQILAVEHDIDSFVAAIGLTRSILEATVRDEEIDIELEDLDFESQLLQPIKTILDSSRSAKTATKKITKRIEDLLRESACLQEAILPRLVSLANIITQATDFGIQLAQQIRAYIADIRTNKEPFRLSVVLSTVRELAATTISGKDTSSWKSVSDLFGRLTNEAVTLLPVAMEADHVEKIVTGVAPWVARIEEVRAIAAINRESELKVRQLNDELQGLARTIRARDQSLQEAGVRIELMERRNETVKKHVDRISELETDMMKARKQESAYEEAIEQLQAELDGLEQENARLKTSAPNIPDRAGHGLQPLEVVEPAPVESNMETSHLLEQIEALRGAVRFLRSENSFLKGQDLLQDIKSLPPLPELDPSSESSSEPSASEAGDSDDTESDSYDSFRVEPTIRTLDTVSKVLYRDVLRFSSSPRVVDLSIVNDPKTRGTWIPQKKTPQHQLWERKAEAKRLQDRLRGLNEQAEALKRKVGGSTRTRK